MSPADHPWFRAHPVGQASIVWHWDQATSDEIRQGLRWYALANEVATVIANGYTSVGAGVLAVYSAQQGWIATVHLAARVLRAGVGIGGSGCGAFASSTQKRAADRLLAGEHHQQVLSGPKVRAFAHLIEHGGAACHHIPDSKHRDGLGCPHVVVDRHALSVAHGQSLSIAQYSSAPLQGMRRRDGTISHPHYDHLARLYQHAAATISRSRGQRVAAHQVQAVTWLVRQRLTQTALRERGMSLLDHGRETARRNAEHAWHAFRTTHLPHLRDWPPTGYLTAA
jgi:hypothetical protein